MTTLIEAVRLTLYGIATQDANHAVCGLSKLSAIVNGLAAIADQGELALLDERTEALVNDLIRVIDAGGIAEVLAG